MFLELRHLKWAIIASQHRSLRRAAEALNVRQSTLSRRLRDLEAQIGAKLFERTNGGTSTTLAGREFLASARHILSETDVALRKLQTRSRGENGQLTIGVYASLSTGNMFATLLEHHQAYPEVEVRMVDGGRDELVCDLTNKIVDIAIMTDSRCGWDDRVLPLWSERVIAAIPVQHPLAKLEAVHWPDLAGEPLLVTQYGVGPELERLLTSKLGSYGQQRMFHQQSGLDRLLSMVAAEYGVLLMLEGATGLRYDNVTYREVRDGEGPTRLGFAAYWRESNDNPALTPFLALLRKRYPDLSILRPSH